jgi:hypothetical protein
VTEEEAKTKWCPFARTMGIDGDVIMPAANRVFMFNGDNKLTFPHPEMCACIASKCMAWVQTDNEAGPSKPGDPEPVYKPAGRCGLAGRP